jgi:hypothetical protein
MGSPTIEFLMKGLQSSAHHELGHVLDPKEVRMLMTEIERLRAAAVGANVGADQSVLQALVAAWEALPGGYGYTPRQIERWLVDDMSPAINAARAALRVGTNVRADETSAKKSADTSID